jgi:hypothetical protein
VKPEKIQGQDLGGWRVFWHPWRRARLLRGAYVGGDYPGISVDIPRVGYAILGRVCRSGHCGCCWRCVGLPETGVSQPTELD